MRSLALAIGVGAVLVAAGCGSDSDSSADSAPEARTTSAESASAETGSKLRGPKPEVEVPRVLPKKLVVTDLKEGTGARAKRGEELTVQFVGVRYDGSPFQSSWEYEEEPFTFKLGAGEVIPGWEKGLPGMRVGGRRELIVPPSLLYGDRRNRPWLGPEDTLVYVIDLLSIE